MKSFQQFITEASYDPDIEGKSQIRKQGEGGRVRAARKKESGYRHKSHTGQEKRVKAVGGGKTEPVEYKTRKDAGTSKSRSQRLQQPTKERGSASLSPREQQRKARAERLAGKSNKKDLDKAATKLLTKKKKTVDPDYKPQKASGYTAHERRKIRRAGERLVRDIKKGKEKHISHYDPKV